MVVINTDNNSGVEVEVNLPDTFDDRDAAANAEPTSYEEEEDGGGSFWSWSWRFWVWDSINQMTIVMAMAMLCLFILLGFTTNSLSATAVKNNMSSTSKATKAPSAKATKAPTAKSTKTKPITVTECGLSFTDQKVVLTDNLDCGSRIGGQQDCAVTLNGPKAKINCNGNTLSQVAKPPNYADGPFVGGICLNDGATAKYCNVEKFNNGIRVTDGAEVRSSFLTSNNNGIVAVFTEDVTLTIEDTDASSNNNVGLDIGVGNGANAQLIVKGKVTLNSNGLAGMNSLFGANTKLEINVENGSTLESCGNKFYDILGEVKGAATFSGTGYNCSSTTFFVGGGGTVVEPVCQACPDP